LGLVHSMDVNTVAERIEAGDWSPQEVTAFDLPLRFTFVRSPQGLWRAAQDKP